MLVLSFLLLVLLFFFLWSLFICLLVKISMRSLLKGRHAQYCWHWLTDWEPSNTLDVCETEKVAGWASIRLPGRNGASCQRAAQPFSRCFSWVPAGSQFRSSGSFTWRGSKLTGLFCYCCFFFYYYLIIRREEKKIITLLFVWLGNTSSRQFTVYPTTLCSVGISVHASKLLV